MLRRALLLVTLACLFASLAIAAVPTSITVQGKLTDASGVPLSGGIKQFTFKIFNAASGGAEIWPNGAGELQFIVSDANGLWSANAGSSVPLNDLVFSDTIRWLEITVTDGIMAPVTLPRIRLVTGPYAFRVATVDGASGGSISSKWMKKWLESTFAIKSRKTNVMIR